MKDRLIIGSASLFLAVGCAPLSENPAAANYQPAPISTPVNPEATKLSGISIAPTPEPPKPQTRAEYWQGLSNEEIFLAISREVINPVLQYQPDELKLHFENIKVRELPGGGIEELLMITDRVKPTQIIQVRRDENDELMSIRAVVMFDNKNNADIHDLSSAHQILKDAFGDLIPTSLATSVWSNPAIKMNKETAVQVSLSADGNAWDYAAVYSSPMDPKKSSGRIVAVFTRRFDADPDHDLGAFYHGELRE